MTCSNGGVCKPYSQYMGYEQYTCECPERFEGNQCEIDLDPCANNPCGGNGNQWLNSIKTCFVYYWGISSVQILTYSHRLNSNQIWFVFVGECLNIENVPNEFLCRCRDNYQGQFCRYGKFCHSSPCKNGGSCIEGPSSFICHCPPGFTGTYSDQQRNHQNWT